jgi:catechol 2,3-dioxygenase-like lactoylglutathione lyase family enzyme
MATSVNAVRSQTASVGSVALALALEVVVIPVSDVARAKAFYATLGWRLDADVTGDHGVSLVQFTPPGSACSIQFGSHLFGTAVKAATPGSAQGLYLVVPDIEAARNALLALGVDVSEVFHCPTGLTCRFPGNDGRVSGRAPGGTSYGSFASFTDPDGNGWLLQEITTRLPGRVAGDTMFHSASDLAAALRRAAAAHGAHEARIGKADPDWPDWYAEYMRREQSGEPLPT